MVAMRRAIDGRGGMQYWRTMIRTVMALALMTMLAGCDEKKDVAAPAATTTVALTPTLAKVVASTPSGTAAAPSGESAKPSGESVGPSGAAAAPSRAASENSRRANRASGFLPPSPLPRYSRRATGNCCA